MRELNERIKNIPVPEKMRALPIDERGFPIPKFVPYIDGKPEFRGFDPNHMRACVLRKKCWLCGDPLGVHLTFVIGPMCAINRISSEPPSHHNCAEYSAKACPFLSQPKMRRNEKDLPEDRSVAGIAIRRNPGVILLWTTRSYKIRNTRTGALFVVGEPEQIEFFCEGRIATREEVLESVNSGLPSLIEVAKEDGPEAETELLNMTIRAMELIQEHTNGN